MKIRCPLCRSVIPAERLNFASDRAACDWCDLSFSFADLATGGGVPDGFDLHAPPRGAWFEQTPGGWRVGASTRSPSAFFLIPFLCVWGGAAIAGLCGAQVVEGVFDPVRTLIGIPFLIGTALWGALAAMWVGGKVEVRVEGEQGSAFTGVGRLGDRQRFNWASVTAVALEVGPMRGSNRMVHKRIILADPTWFRFGFLLSPARREYMLHALRQLLASRS